MAFASSLLSRRLRPSLRSFSTSLPPAVTEIKSVGIVGLGLMGHGIAQLAASNGYKVVGVESNADALTTGKNRIEGSLGKLLARSVKKGKLTDEEAVAKQTSIMDNLSFSVDKTSLADCDLVVEAIVENMAIKVPFYEDLGKIVKPSAIFASNTSSLPITQMALASRRPDRFVGLHYFNPVQLMQLTEVISTEHTDPAVFELTKQWSNSLGKTSVACGDTPGFIVNRLLVPALAQAMLLVDRGDASVGDVDVSMQLGAGHPMGPLKLADYVGLDTCLSILEGWTKEFPDESAFVVPASLRKKVAAGHLGRKSGHGYYTWDGDKPIAPSDEPLL